MERFNLMAATSSLAIRCLTRWAQCKKDIWSIFSVMFSSIAFGVLFFFFAFLKRYESKRPNLIFPLVTDCVSATQGEWCPNNRPTVNQGSSAPPRPTQGQRSPAGLRTKAQLWELPPPAALGSSRSPTARPLLLRKALMVLLGQEEHGGALQGTSRWPHLFPLLKSRAPKSSFD